MQSSFSKRLIVSLALISFARADYYIDDQNFTSLVYSENPEGVQWGAFQQGHETLFFTLANGTVLTVDASQCFNYTYTYAPCSVADNCQVEIAFSGSGIAIYVLQAGTQGMNASLAIDGGAPKYNVLPAPPGPYFYIPNVTLFTIQGIATGNHTATITVQNWDNLAAGIMFDYALINQTIVSTTTTSSVASSTAAPTTSTPTSAPTTPSPSSSTTNVGAIVGGVVGGLAALIVPLLAVFCLCRRCHGAQRVSANLHVEPRMEPFSAESLYQRTPEQYTTSVTEPPTSENLVTGPINARTPPQSTSSGSSRRDKARFGIMGQIAGLTATSPTQTGSSNTYSQSETSRPRIQQTHPTLTDDQADFVNNLYGNNVPAGAIARVIERMMAGERRPAVDGFDSLPPPSYHHGGSDE